MARMTADKICWRFLGGISHWIDLYSGYTAGSRSKDNFERRIILYSNQKFKLIVVDGVELGEVSIGADTM